MTIYSDARGKVIDVGGNPLLKLVGFGIAAFLIVVLLFSSITRVATGHAGVLTLFGRVTGEVLPEGMHLINPLKSNNEMSIQRAFQRRPGDEPGHVSHLPSQSGQGSRGVPEDRHRL
jgi:regulator of protease activity HflC (stomatin/prohibitin superfamily)